MYHLHHTRPFRPSLDKIVLWSLVWGVLGGLVLWGVLSGVDALNQHATAFPPLAGVLGGLAINGAYVRSQLKLPKGPWG